MNSSSALTQGYLSKFVPLEFLPNTIHLSYEDGKYIVSSINFVNDISTSTIIELDENFDTIRTINHLEVLFGRKTPQKLNGKYFAYAADETTNRETHLLIEMDENFSEIKRDTFYPDGNSHNANGMTIIGDKIIGSAWDYYDCEELNECTFMNYKVISTEGEELQSFNVDEEGEPYFFSFEVDHTADGDIICGGNRYELPYAKASVYKSTQEGNILWKYESTQRQSRGNVPVWVEELSNGNIVYTDKLDKLFDDDYIDLGYSLLPAQLVWLSPDGDSLFSYLDTVNWASSSEFSGIKRGRGDYFFAYGQYYLNHLDPMEFDAVYGSIMKITNDGEIVWRRLYKHSDDPYGTPTIAHIYEHENGDISTLGREVNDDGFFMWMMRVNEHGCLGDISCDFPMILPVADLSGNGHEDNIKIYPNPTSDILNIKSETIPERVEVFTIDGALVLTKEGSDNINITNISSGLFFIKIFHNGKVSIRSFIKY